MKPLQTLCILAAIVGGEISAQVRDTTLRKDLPRLEIPEITIVGKKAITLPFARKGEIFDVPLYEALPPDSSLLTARPEILLPGGTLPRYQQREMPWRLSAEGSAGSYGTFGFRGYVDYHTQGWNLSTTAGYRRTDGHVTNSGGNEFDIGGRYTSLVSTDNDILKNFRFSGEFNFRHDRFGVFGLMSPGAERSRDIFGIGASASSIRRSGLVLDLSLGADVFSVTDALGGVDSGVTVTSPELNVSITGDVGDYRIISEFRYASSSLDYQTPVSSPSLFNIVGAIQWRVSEKFFLKAGAEFSNGTGSSDNSRSHVAPLAELEWEIDAGRRVNLWFRSNLTLAPYSRLAERIPFVVREAHIVPEEKQVDLGGSFWYNSGMLTLQLGGAYVLSDDRQFIVSNGGMIMPAYAKVWQIPLSLEGSIRAGEDFRLKFDGVFQPTREEGGDVQLPMVPLGRFGAEIGYDVTDDWTVTGASRYWSRRNADRSGVASLGSVFLLDAGVSTTIIPHMVLSASVRNLAGTEYRWWQSFTARGRDILVTARARF